MILRYTNEKNQQNNNINFYDIRCSTHIINIVARNFLNGFTLNHKAQKEINNYSDLYIINPGQVNYWDNTFENEENNDEYNEFNEDYNNENDYNFESEFEKEDIEYSETPKQNCKNYDKSIKGIFKKDFYF